MNHKKHITNWFTTSAYRAINLSLVTDVVVMKTGQVIDGAIVHQAIHDGRSQVCITVDAADARRLFDLLF